MNEAAARALSAAAAASSNNWVNQTAESSVTPTSSVAAAVTLGVRFKKIRRYL